MTLSKCAIFTIGVYGEIVRLCRIRLKFRFSVHNKRWHTACKFQLEKRRNKKVFAKKRIIWQTYMKYTVCLFREINMSARDQKDSSSGSIESFMIYMSQTKFKTVLCTKMCIFMWRSSYYRPVKLVLHLRPGWFIKKLCARLKRKKSWSLTLKRLGYFEA